MTHDEAIRTLKRNPNARITVEDLTPGESDAEIEAAQERCKPAVLRAHREAHAMNEAYSAMRGLVAAVGIAGAFVLASLAFYAFGVAVEWLFVAAP